MDVSIQTHELAGLVALWRRAPQITAEETQRSVWQAELLVQREVVERTPTSTGTLRKSIIAAEPVVAGETVIGEVTTPLNYAIPVELGTRPFKPPIGAIMDWLGQRGQNGPDARSAAFAIQTAISRRGLKAHHMFRDGYRENRNQVRRILEGAVPRIIARLEGDA